MCILSMHTFWIIFHVHQLHFFYFIRLQYFCLKNYDFLTRCQQLRAILASDNRALWSVPVTQENYFHLLPAFALNNSILLHVYASIVYVSVNSIFCWLREVLAAMFYLYQERFEGTKGVIQRCNNDHVIKSIFTKIASFSIFGKNHKNYKFQWKK